MTQLEIELTSLAKETDEASAERREAIERELADLKERSEAMKAQRQSEKEAIQGVRELKARLEEARQEAERAERAADLERAAELRDGEIPDLEKRSAALEGGPDGSGRPAHRGLNSDAASDAADSAQAHPAPPPQSRSFSRRRSMRMTSRRSWPGGPGSRRAACSRARSRS